TLVAFHRLEQGAGVLSPLPRGDAARIDRLHAVRLGRPDHPGDDVPGPLLLARFEQIEHELVVGHEHERGLVDNRNVVQFFVRVDVDAAGKHEHAARINNLVARLRRLVVDDAPAGDADVLDRAIDAVGGIVDLAAGDPNHARLFTAAPMRRMTSSSVGYGDRRAGRNGSGTSSIRYEVPGALTPV